MTPRRLIEPARLAGSTLLRTQSDERLVDLTRDGNDRAFEAIVQRYRRPLLRYCSRMLPAARAEDAVQQAFLNAYTAILADDAQLNLKPWLYRIAHNATLSALRQKGWAHEQLDESADGVERPDQAAERRERLGEVLGAVKGLPERQRDAIVLRELEGRSYDEIASRLDVSDGAVRQLLNRARNTLRAAAAMLVPPDLAAKLAMRGEPADSIGARIADLCTGAGGAALAAKLGAAVVVAGAVAGGAAHAPVPGLDAGRGGASPAPLVAEASAASPTPGSTRLISGHGSGRLVGDGGQRRHGRQEADHRSHANGGDRRGRDGDGHRVAEHGDDRSGRRDGGDSEDRDHSGGDSSGPGGGGSDDSAEPVSTTQTTETSDDRASSNSGPSSTSGSETTSSDSGSDGSDDFTTTSGETETDGR